MGYGLISCQGDEPSLITMGVLQLGKLPNQALKLQRIFEKTLALIDEYHPDELAIEAPFFGKNVQSMLKLGRAQGVAMAACLHREVPIREYSPRKIKQAITGRGNASKEQVSGMLMRLLSIVEAPAYFDATDAVAVAVCHFFQGDQQDDSKRFSGWKAFLDQNPDRLIK